ncbi:MAG: hypothetical protein JW841_12350 [Deltaproteobacteria bacterium]|nr:hypothetical protein [Deltaproteobacteria bacterium]
MIIECPHCKTAHSKSEKDLAGGAYVVCRRCGASFCPALQDNNPDPTIPLVSSSNLSANTPPSFSQVSGDNIEFVSADDISAIEDLNTISKDNDAIDLSVNGGEKISATSSSESEPAKFVPPVPFSIDFGELANDHAASSTPLITDLDAPAEDPNLKQEMNKLELDNSEADSNDNEAAGELELDFQSKQKSQKPQPNWSSDVVTDVIQTESFHKKHNVKLKIPGEHKAIHRGARGHVFPKDAWHQFTKELFSYLRSAPIKDKLIIGGIAAIPIIIFTILIILAFSSNKEVAYLTESQELFSGPMTGEVYQNLGSIEPGSRVEVVDSYGAYSLIIDSLGRAGYVLTRSLRIEAPPSLPSKPFADCSRSPTDKSVEHCQKRSQEQFEACREFCSSDAEDPYCSEHCQKRFSDCLLTCENEGSKNIVPVANAKPENATTEKEDSKVQSKNAKSNNKKKKSRRSKKRKRTH